MYDKIAFIMRRDFGATDISGTDVENYLRDGDMTFIDAIEAQLIDSLVSKYS